MRASISALCSWMCDSLWLLGSPQHHCHDVHFCRRGYCKSRSFLCSWTTFYCSSLKIFFRAYSSSPYLKSLDTEKSSQFYFRELIYFLNFNFRCCWDISWVHKLNTLKQRAYEHKKEDSSNEERRCQDVVCIFIPLLIMFILFHFITSKIFFWIYINK